MADRLDALPRLFSFLTASRTYSRTKRKINGSLGICTASELEQREYIVQLNTALIIKKTNHFIFQVYLDSRKKKPIEQTGGVDDGLVT